MTRRVARPRRAGITLIEVMVALTIFSIVATLIYGAFIQPGRHKARVEEDIDRHHVKSDRPRMQIMPRDVVDGHADHSTLLPAGDRFDRQTAFGGRLHLHLDEDDGLALLCHDVDFAMPGAIALRKNCVPTIDQFLAREFLAGFAESLTGIGHVRPGVTRSGPD